MCNLDMILFLCASTVSVTYAQDKRSFLRGVTRDENVQGFPLPVAERVQSFCEIGLFRFLGAFLVGDIAGDAL
jgi:hypothetical protein